MAVQAYSAGNDIPPFEFSQSDTVDDAQGDSSRCNGPTEENAEELPSYKEEIPSYKITHKQYKGIFALFTHEKFDDPNVPMRDGNSVDIRKIKDVWRKLGFKVETHENLSYSDIKVKVENCQCSYNHGHKSKYFSKIAKTLCLDSENNYHESYDAFFCAVLTHGEKGDWLHARDKTYSVDDLTGPFQSCKSLVGKPKVFFIQACRGKDLDEGRDMPDAATTQCGSRTREEKVSVRVPKEADFLIAYATPPGYYAWRNSDSGSWFIQILCKCVEKYAHRWDLMSILTQVNREVGQRQSSTNLKKFNEKKQCPSIVSRLTALLYLFPTQTHSPATHPVTEGSLAYPQYETSCKSGERDKGGDEDEEQRVYMKLKQDLMRKKMEVLTLKQQVYQMKLESSSAVKFEV